VLQVEIYAAANELQKASKLISNITRMDFPDMHTEYIMRYLLFFPNDFAARIFKKQGQLDLAIQEYQKIMSKEKMFPDRQLIHPILYFRLGVLFTMAGNLRQALPIYQKFLELYKDANSKLPEVIEAKRQITKLSGNNG